LKLQLAPLHIQKQAPAPPTRKLIPLLPHELRMKQQLKLMLRESENAMMMIIRSANLSNSAQSSTY
jgi:hypothetical protein